MGLAKFNFYTDKPLFGLDIGHSSMKVVQFENTRGKKPKIVGYGVSNYYPENAISNGAIVNFEVLAQNMQELFKDRLVGEISAKRVACTITTSHTFNRTITLPPMDKRHIEEAVKLEAEQYIPIPLESLYLDYDIYKNDAAGIELLLVATPKNVVDSTIKFLDTVGYEAVVIEPTMNATARMFKFDRLYRGEPSLLIDFGSISVDLAVFDQSMFVNSTISGGSDTLTNLVSKRLNLTPSEAYVTKSRYGIGAGEKMSAEIMEAARPILDPLVREARKTIRYFEERAPHGHRKISQIIVTGGGATLRGINEYLTINLGVPSRMLDPWPNIDFGGLEPPSDMASPMYITAAGVAILHSKGMSQ